MEFDPASPETFLAEAPSRWRRVAAVMRVLPFVLVGALLVAAGLHAWHVLAGWPLDFEVDNRLMGAVRVAKLAALVGVGLALSQAYKWMARDVRRGAWAFLVWTCCGLVVVLSMVALRGVIGGLGNRGSVQYYEVGLAPSWQIDHAKWENRWRRGEIFAIEFGLAVVLAAVHAVIGVALGRWRWVALVVGVGVTVVLLSAHVAVFGLFESTWDNFHRDIYSSPLLLDLFVRVLPAGFYAEMFDGSEPPLTMVHAAIEPYAHISSLVYAGVTAGCGLMMLRGWSARRAARGSK